MLCHRLQRWPNNKPALDQRILIAGQGESLVFGGVTSGIAMIKVYRSGHHGHMSWTYVAVVSWKKIYTI